MEKNESTLDRTLRIALGLGLLTLLLIGPVPGWGLVGLIGLVPLLTGTVGFCPLYKMIGYSTAKD